MKKFWMLTISLMLLFAVSCGSGKDDTDCPTGYIWDGTECVPDGINDTPDDNGISDTPDKDVVPDEADDDPDEDIDPDEDPYEGDCIPVKAGGNLEIDIKTHEVTIGDITVNGVSRDSSLYGELWAKNSATLSEFKLADITASVSGEKYNFPTGQYDFFFRKSQFDNIVEIKNNVQINSDTTVNIDIPLYFFTGTVRKNGASFNVDAEYESETEIRIRSGSYEFIIPYLEFSGFELLVPEGNYSVYFKGQLSTEGPAFEGTVFKSGDGILIEEDSDIDINIETVTYSGNVINEGYSVNEGQLILAENPPMGAMTTVVVEDLAEKSFSVEVIKDVEYSLLYLPEEGTYPARYIRIESWSDTDNPSTRGGEVIMDFARLYGTISFLGSSNLPTVSKCSGAGCSRGKLKVVGFDFSSYLIKDFGVEGDDMTYETLIVRRTKAGEETYIPRNYTMVFESHLNDIEGVFDHIPFELTLKYLNQENNLVSGFNFLNIDETYFLEREINFNISPVLVEGTLKLDGTAMETSLKDDFIIVKNELGIETPVANISELSGGNYSFFIPEGNYDIIYHGKEALGEEFKTNIRQNLDISGNLSGFDLDLVTVRLLAGFQVNGEDFADWAKDAKTVDSYSILINPDKTAATYYFDLSVTGDGTPYVKILTGSTLNIYIEMYFKSDEKKERSFVRMPMLLGEQISSDTLLDMPLFLVPFTTTISVNGEPVTGASDYVAAFKIPGQNRTEIYYPSTEGNKAEAVLKKGEHRSPRPEITLNDGFDTKQSIQTECIYLY